MRRVYRPHAYVVVPSLVCLSGLLMHASFKYDLAVAVLRTRELPWGRSYTNVDHRGLRRPPAPVQLEWRACLARFA